MSDKPVGPRPTMTERAFELARSGANGSVEEIIRQLRREGHFTDGRFGPSIRRQLRELIGAARQRETNPPGLRRFTGWTVGTVVGAELGRKAGVHCFESGAAATAQSAKDRRDGEASND